MYLAPIPTAAASRSRFLSDSLSDCQQQVMRWVLVAAVGSLLVEVSVRKWLHLKKNLKKIEKQKQKLEEKCKQLQKKYDSERVHQQVSE